MQSLVESLATHGYIKSESVKRAFVRVDRKIFVPISSQKTAYVDRPLSIGHGQTISAPSMIAIMLETLSLKKGDRVLEIGAGSGYNAALISEIVGKNVISIERIPELAILARKNLKKAGSDIKVIVGDGTLGYAEESPYDKIIVTAAAPKIPKRLIEQLKIGGKLCIPVGKQYFCTLTVVKKTDEGKIEKKKYGGCTFVPLIGEEGW
ncbi:MAG: protein-L-isoaspartate(D-aspartate) O-methyltransferase [Euryarchaeota archaeon]|nr:protein-L-isoaspartate(D-aspartate) O-methyltransferase [Euryarchaeota archaeon]